MSIFPKVSIITVVFNSKNKLKPTMESVLNQTYKNIEYIVIDGASTDGTLGLIKENAHNITTWISEPDKGIYDAMNKGLKAATGDYVWFLNAGDLLSERTIIEDIFLNENEYADVFYGETTIIDDNGKKLGMRRLKAPKKLTWNSFRFGMLVCHQSFVAKRSLAPQYDLQYKISSDFDWVLNILKKTKNIRNTHKTLSIFENAGVSSKNFLKTNKDRFRVMEKHYGFIPTVLCHFVMIFRLIYTYLKLGRM